MKHINPNVLFTLRDTFWKLYHEDKLTIDQIASRYKRNERTIQRWFKRLAIPIRESGETRKLLGSQRRQRHYKYKGFYIHPQGYRVVYDDAKTDVRVLEHRKIMEQHLGRKLTTEEVVHHKNGNRLDNRIENLEVLKNQSEHVKLHAQQDRKWGFRGHTKQQYA